MGSIARILAPKALVSYLLAIGTIFATGCLFTPRDAEPPNDDQVEWISPTKPGNVLANMKAALESETTTNYENSLSEEFIFIPWSQTEAEAPSGYFSAGGEAWNWDFDRELDSLDNLYSSVSSIRLDWNFDESTDLTEGQNEAEISLDDYELTVIYNNSTEETVYQGEVRLYFRYESGKWLLDKWDESVLSNPDFTLPWGELRTNLQVPPA
jgi:hypothetical protein